MQRSSFWFYYIGINLFIGGSGLIVLSIGLHNIEKYLDNFDTCIHSNAFMMIIIGISLLTLTFIITLCTTLYCNNPELLIPVRQVRQVGQVRQVVQVGHPMRPRQIPLETIPEEFY